MTTNFIASNYDRFSDRVWLWSNVDEFINVAEFRDGIHQIGLEDGTHFDILFRGVSGQYRTLPVFFNGAVSRINTNPPYFSGSNVAVDVGAPVIAIADPTLNLAPDLGIGWYTGGPDSNFPAELTRVLESLREKTGAKLVFVGGSAGGFAAINFATTMNETALVWNPQIDLLKYNPDHVSQFLSVIFDSVPENEDSSPSSNGDGSTSNQDAADKLSACKVRFRLESLLHLDRLIYLQNKSDNHEGIHAAPIRERSGFSVTSSGVYTNENRTMVVANFNAGHRAPSRELITSVLGKLLEQNLSTLDIAQSTLAEFDVST